MAARHRFQPPGALNMHYEKDLLGKDAALAAFPYRGSRLDRCVSWSQAASGPVGPHAATKYGPKRTTAPRVVVFIMAPRLSSTYL